ncbi:hypothetical protein MPH_12674 [Macrophomina phaseolina MS6]|uniref:Geranylgeranyl pyrophosphate synthetase n=1 Tax=Macrophomina phaseolina (strain MS6) TaxID=1126212 RepID=K2RJC2_MACPH|nr:hypothetical protein MPH_12674 [Macrophomina phaseolina MS6]
MQLKEDSGTYFRDINAASYSAHSIEPAVRAIAAQDPSFSGEDVDIFACASTLGNLLRFVRRVDKPFRFTVEVVGNTVFFVRRENDPRETIQGVRGYGHTFPEAYTTWEEEAEGSQSHQRLVKYDFAGLACVVRFEGDGYLKHLDPDPQPGPGILAGPSSATRLQVQSGGRVVPQAAVFDLKTRSAKRMDQDVLGEEMARLWVAQIPNFVLAFHERGTFNTIRVHNVRKEVQQWERENEGTLRQLAALIRQIASIGKGRNDKRMEVRRKDIDVLEVREQVGDAPAALPEEMKAWWKGADVDGQSDSSSDDGSDDEPFFSAGSDTEAGAPLLESDDESDRDYTACSAEDCGYCGRCRY